MSKSPRFQVPTSDQALQRTENIAARPPIKMTVRLPDEVHRWLTIKARDERSSAQEIMLGMAMKAMRRETT
jgi:predicted HicB family RNase H-like nuclease